MKVYFEHIYEHIGYLFYALATERGELNEVTFDKLLRLIDQQWYPPGNGTTFESHLVSCLHSGLRCAFDNSMAAENAFDQFKAYYDLHRIPFGQSLRSKIVSTANTISSAFSGNGSRSVFLTSLEKLLAASHIALV